MKHAFKADIDALDITESQDEISETQAGYVKKFVTLTAEHERIGKVIVNSAYRVHNELGPGLLEKIYEICLMHEIAKTGLHVTRQSNIPVTYDGLTFEEGLRLDLLVEEKVIVEIKAVDLVNPVWQAQVISHLKLTHCDLGYLINFNVPLIKNGIQRFLRT